MSPGHRARAAGRAGMLAAAALLALIGTDPDPAVGPTGPARSGAVRSTAPPTRAAGSAAPLAAGAPAATLGFERNVGQTAREVRFLARGPDGAVFLTGTGAVMSVGGAATADVTKLALAGAAPAPAVTGSLPLAPTANYLIGRRRSGWHSRVPAFGQVVYHSVYPGIDLRYQAAGERLEYDFTVGAGADPRRIAVEPSGARRVGITAAGSLVVTLAHHSLVHRRPDIYQEVGGIRRAIGGGYIRLGPRRVGFAVARYDRSRPLVIDPTITYSTELAGSRPGAGRAVAVDRAGNTYVTGETASPTFPTTRPIQGHARGATDDAFVTKLDPAGRVVYSTYLGGSRYTAARGIAVDGAGSVYLTGATNSTDFPTSRGAVQRSYGGGPFDAFVTKLDASGTAVAYSTFLGDTHYDEGNAVAVDAHGQAVVTGRTVSPQFPVIGPPGLHVPGGAFVARLNRAGSRLVSSAVFGGPGSGDHGDTGFGVAVDSKGNTYVTGVTNATGFPTTRALQPALGGRADAFVVKIGPGAAGVVYSTYLGAAGDDVGRAIAADGDGYAYVAGLTTSRNLPTANPVQAAKASAQPDGSDAFVAKLEPTGAGLVYATYLGGSGEDSAAGIAVDRARNVYVTGLTASADFPLARPVQAGLRGAGDAFVAELDRGGSAVDFSTFLGGGGGDAGLGVAVDRAGGIHLTGATSSPDFPRRGHAAPPRRGTGARPGDGAFVAILRAVTR